MASYKKIARSGFTLAEIIIVIVIVGLLAAMAVPAFNKVREQSRIVAITNNLKQVAAAGQQYLMNEAPSNGEVTYEQLTTAGFLKPINPVAGESYIELTILDSTESQQIGFDTVPGVSGSIYHTY